jgi:hypothetical protein
MHACAESPQPHAVCARHKARLTLLPGSWSEGNTRRRQRLPRHSEGTAEAAGLERRQLLERMQGLWRAGGTLL